MCRPECSQDFYGIRKTQYRLADEQWLDKKDLPYTIAMIGLDIAAPIFLMLGIANTNSANVSLINNFEIVATSVIALVIFKEKNFQEVMGRNYPCNAIQCNSWF